MRKSLRPYIELTVKGRRTRDLTPQQKGWITRRYNQIIPKVTATESGHMKGARYELKRFPTNWSQYRKRKFAENNNLTATNKGVLVRVGGRDKASGGKGWGIKKGDYRFTGNKLDLKKKVKAGLLIFETIPLEVRQLVDESELRKLIEKVTPSNATNQKLALVFKDKIETQFYAPEEFYRESSKYISRMVDRNGKIYEGLEPALRNTYVKPKRKKSNANKKNKSTNTKRNSNKRKPSVQLVRRKKKT